MRVSDIAYKREYSDMYSKDFDDAKQMLEYGLMRQNVSSVLGVKVVSIEDSLKKTEAFVKIHVAMDESVRSRNETLQYNTKKELLKAFRNGNYRSFDFDIDAVLRSYGEYYF